MSIKLNKRVDLLSVGDKVTTEFTMYEEEVVRTITMSKKDKQYGSGYVASVDGGEPCKCCGLAKYKPIENVDAAWFNPT